MKVDEVYLVLSHCALPFCLLSFDSGSGEGDVEIHRYYLAAHVKQIFLQRSPLPPPQDIYLTCSDSLPDQI